MMTIIVRTMLLTTVFAVSIFRQHAPEENIFRPDVIDDCLNKPMLKTAISVDEKRNPFYLRGDFDGDGAADYAVVVRDNKTSKRGVLICTAKGTSFLLGVSGSQPFSDMPHDRFIAPNWRVYSKQETAELGKFDSNVPNPMPAVQGETIAMVWEDGISIIYWDGKQFRWAGAKT